MKVIDASAAAAVAFAEPEAGEVLAAIGDDPACAPYLLPFELTNIARSKSRERPEAASIIEEQLQNALSLPIELMPVDFVEVLRLAEKARLSGYDASYLWLAKALGVPLVTLDKQLRRAARLE